MDIRFSGKNVSVTEGIKDHIQEKLSKLERYAPRLVETHVILKKEKYRYEAEMTLLAKNLRAYGEGLSKENIYAAIDQAYLRIEKQLKKFRERVKDHHKGQEEEVSLPKRKKAQKPSQGPLESKPSIVRTPSFAVKPMSAEEASMQLELSDRPFLAFLNASTNRVNVIYKRDDGNHGLIEPTF